MLDLVPVQGGEAHMGFTSPFSNLVTRTSKGWMMVELNKTSFVQVVGAGEFTVWIYRAATSAGDIRYYVEVCAANTSATARITFDFKELRSLVDLIQLIAIEIKHDGHASSDDRVWIRELAMHARSIVDPPEHIPSFNSDESESSETTSIKENNRGATTNT
ncbi:MAG: hypothetical protein KDB01_20455 [Planctomycetaceae bacterium]|nr:hypothetical protein [Planctomycetaceae bacterium]